MSMRIPTLSQFRHQADMITKQFDKMRNLQQQIYSGKKIINPSDDPVLASQVRSTEDAIAQLQSYDKNGTLAHARTQYFQTSAQSAVGLMSDVQRLLLQVQDTTNPSDKANIAKQLQGDLTNLLNIANTRDPNGEYIFGGYNTNMSPYIQSGGTYQYQGGYDVTMIDVSPTAQALYNESGFNVFGNIPLGNGVFTVSASNSNTGTASTSAGTTATNGTYVPDTYTISFVTNSAGKLAYQVVGASTGQVIPPPPTVSPAGAPAYVPGSGSSGMDITFNGITINIGGGMPNVGDSFQIQPTTKQNVFNTIQNVIDTLQNPPNNKGMFDQIMKQANASFTQVSKSFIAYQSDVGTRSVNIDNQISANKQLINYQTVVLSDLQDADMADVFSQLAQQSLALQATQEGYLKIQETFSQLLKLG